MSNKYRIFIINTDYSDYISSVYNSIPELKEKSFPEQYAYRTNSLFGTADFYSKNLKTLGHEAIDIIANHGSIQKQCNC
jgi:predicted Zn-dependent protease